MGSTRRRFTEEYKAQAVAFIIDDRRPVAEVARNIGVHEMTLGKWVKKARDAGGDSPDKAVGCFGTSRTGATARRERRVAYAGGVRKESSDLVRERKAVIFAAIADWADSDEYPVEFMCGELGVSRSGYYAWRGRAPSQRASADEGLLAIITSVCERLRGNPGVRRVHAELLALGHRLSRKRVWRLMKAAGLQGRHPKAWRRTTVAGDQPQPAPDLIGRDFTAEQANQRWCGDMTYVKTWDT